MDEQMRPPARTGGRHEVEPGREMNELAMISLGLSIIWVRLRSVAAIYLRRSCCGDRAVHRKAGKAVGRWCGRRWPPRRSPSARCWWPPSWPSSPADWTVATRPRLPIASGTDRIDRFAADARPRRASVLEMEVAAGGVSVPATSSKSY